MKNIASLKKKYLKDSEIKQAYDALEGEYSLIQSVIQKRIEKSMSQEELAHKIGTKQSAISRLESGKANPSVQFLEKVAEALDSTLVISFQ